MHLPAGLSDRRAHYGTRPVDWALLLTLLAQLVAGAISYGKLSGDVETLRDEVRELRQAVFVPRIEVVPQSPQQH